MLLKLRQTDKKQQKFDTELLNIFTEFLKSQQDSSKPRTPLPQHQAPQKNPNNKFNKIFEAFAPMTSHAIMTSKHQLVTATSTPA